MKRPGLSGEDLDGRESAVGARERAGVRPGTWHSIGTSLGAGECAPRSSSSPGGSPDPQPASASLAIAMAAEPIRNGSDEMVTR